MLIEILQMVAVVGLAFFIGIILGVIVLLNK